MSVEPTTQIPADAPAPIEAVRRSIRRYHREFSDLTMRQRYVLFCGKIRRAYIGHFRRKYVQQQEAARKGSCHRCGACCKLLFKCPFLLEEEGHYTCRIHGNKPENCHIFPINRRDLSDRDLISPKQKCGFYFE
jgi:hypothetical protein